MNILKLIKRTNELFESDVIKYESELKSIIQTSSFLVTGGADFIGSNLCEYFISQGSQVVCLDNFATGDHRFLLSKVVAKKQLLKIYSHIV